MKCCNCQAEWTEIGNNNRENCPFCGEKLIRETVKIEEQTMGSTLNYIRNNYGDAVFADKKKLYSIFKDLAPKLNNELVILQMVMPLNIDKCFIGVPEEKRNDSIYAFKQKAENYLKSSVIDMALDAFSEAFGLNKYEFEDVSSAALYEDTEETTDVIQDSYDDLINENYDVNEQNFKFEGTKLIKYIGRKSYVAVPKKTEIIGENAFSDKKVKEVLLPENLIRIKENAFKNCEKLEKIIIPKSVKSIGQSAFAFCESLKFVVLKCICDKIEDKAFENCHSLEKVAVIGKVKIIGNSCFYRCTSLKEIDVLENCEEFEENLFNQCTSLERIKIPDSLVKIGKKCFWDCSSLKEVVFPENCKCKELSESAFEMCVSLDTIQIPDSLTCIGNYCFSNCRTLKEIRFSNKSMLETIGQGAFEDCTKIKTIVLPDSLKSISDNAFQNCSSLETLISNNNTVFSPSALTGCNNLIINDRKNFEIEGHKLIKYIGKDENVNIPIGIEIIGEEAFANQNVKKVLIPSTVNKIEKRAFYGCLKLKEINIPDSIKDLPESIFENCRSLSTIYLPEKLKSIGQMAFSGCVSLSKNVFSSTKFTDVF